MRGALPPCSSATNAGSPDACRPDTCTQHQACLVGSGEWDAWETPSQNIKVCLCNNWGIGTWCCHCVFRKSQSRCLSSRRTRNLLTRTLSGPAVRSNQRVLLSLLLYFSIVTSYPVSNSYRVCLWFIVHYLQDVRAAAAFAWRWRPGRRLSHRYGKRLSVHLKCAMVDSRVQTPDRASKAAASCWLSRVGYYNAASGVCRRTLATTVRVGRSGSVLRGQNNGRSKWIMHSREARGDVTDTEMGGPSALGRVVCVR